MSDHSSVTEKQLENRVAVVTAPPPGWAPRPRAGSPPKAPASPCSRVAPRSSPSLEPGFTATDLGSHIADQEKRDELAGMFEAIPALSADDIADVVAFLVSRPAHVNLPSLELAPSRQV